MKKIYIIVFLLILFNYVKSDCYELSDDNKIDKDTCLKRKVEHPYSKQVSDFNYTADTCCYVEQTIKCDGKKETYKECYPYDKKNLKKYLDYLKKEAKKNDNKDDDDDDELNCDVKDPKIDCSSYYLQLGLAILLFLF